MSISAALSATPVSSVDLTRYVAIPERTSVKDTVALMCSAGRSSACIMDRDRLAGIFTQRDVLQRVIGRPSSWDRPIEEHMTTPVRTIRNTESVAHGLALMNEWWVRSLPVLDEDGQLVGNLSYYVVTQTIGNLLTSRISGSIGEATVHHGLTLVDFTGLNIRSSVTVHLDDAVDVAVHHMRTRGIGSVLVVNDRGHLVGELTEFDLQNKFGCTVADLSQPTVKDVMTPDPVALRARSPIADLIPEMLEREVSHVPLLGESGRPVGVVSFRDFAMSVETMLETLG